MSITIYDNIISNLTHYKRIYVYRPFDYFKKNDFITYKYILSIVINMPKYTDMTNKEWDKKKKIIIDNTINNKLNDKTLNSFLTSTGYYMRYSKISDDDRGKIIDELIVSPAGFAQPGTIKYDFYEYVKINDTVYVELPRYYAQSIFGNAEYSFHKPHKTNYKFTAKLRPYQEIVIDNYMKGLKEFGGGLIKLGCGKGKTMIAIAITQLLGLKTLIVVHNTQLLGQWKDRISSVTNARIGHIEGKICDIENTDIVVGMALTISKRDYDGLFDQFGLIIFDEAHHYSSKEFSKTVRKTAFQYTLALTATPRRVDGLMKVMHWYIGPIVHTDGVRINPALMVKQVNFFTKDPLFVEQKQWIPFQKKNVVSTVKMVSNIVEIESRNKLIVKILNGLRKERDRYILILGERTEQLKTIKEMLDKILNKEIKKGKLSEDECLTRMHTGEQSQTLRKEALENGRVIFSSMPLGKEGMDAAKLNTLVLITSCKDAEQIVGRIMRADLEIGDIRPLIIDIVDDLSVYNTHAKQRANLYKLSLFNNKQIYAIDSDIVRHNIYDSYKQGMMDEINENDMRDIDDVLYTHKITSDDINEIDIAIKDFDEKQFEINLKKMNKPESTHKVLGRLI